jgi:hypothetical protein
VQAIDATPVFPADKQGFFCSNVKKLSIYLLLAGFIYVYPYPPDDYFQKADLPRTLASCLYLCMHMHNTKQKGGKHGETPYHRINRLKCVAAVNSSSCQRSQRHSEVQPLSGRS